MKKNKENIKAFEARIITYAKAHYAYFNEVYELKSTFYKKLVKIIVTIKFSEDEHPFKDAIEFYFYKLSKEASLKEHALAFQRYLEGNIIRSPFKKSYQHLPVALGLDAFIETKKYLIQKGIKAKKQKQSITKLNKLCQKTQKLVLME